MNPKNLTFNNLKYEAWIRTKPCLVCASPEVQVHHTWHTGKKNGRNSYTSVPLCVTHHTFGKAAYHVLEKEAFEDKHNLNLEWEIINLLSKYIEECVGKEREACARIAFAQGNLTIRDLILARNGE